MFPVCTFISSSTIFVWSVLPQLESSAVQNIKDCFHLSLFNQIFPWTLRLWWCQVKRLFLLLHFHCYYYCGQYILEQSQSLASSREYNAELNTHSVLSVRDFTLLFCLINHYFFWWGSWVWCDNVVGWLLPLSTQTGVMNRVLGSRAALHQHVATNSKQNKDQSSFSSESDIYTRLEEALSQKLFKL